jgi:hypothetical protein
MVKEATPGQRAIAVPRVASVTRPCGEAYTSRHRLQTSPAGLEPIRKVLAHVEGAVSLRSMMRIMARWMKATALRA